MGKTNKRFTIINKEKKQGVFHSGMKHLYGKYCLGYTEIQSWTSRISPVRDGTKNVPVSYKRNNTFMKKRLVFWSSSFSRPGSHMNSPLSKGPIKLIDVLMCWFTRTIYLCCFWRSKTKIYLILFYTSFSVSTISILAFTGFIIFLR